MPSSILILSASVGNGHGSAAAAIETRAAERGFPVRNFDTLDFTPPAFRIWYAGGYENLVRRSPRLWGHLYRSSDRPLFNFWFQTALDRFMCKGLDRLISEDPPEWVICTHSLPQPYLAKIRKKRGFRVGVCVTDIHPHLMWLRGSPDRYFVPTSMTKDLLELRQPQSKGRVVITGMPIHPAFTQAGTHLDKPNILISSGGISGGPVIEVVRSFSGLGIRLTVATGRNENLRRELIGLNFPKEVEILGNLKIEEMAEKMRQASLMIGKPGGLTTFETLAVGLPLIVYSPLMIPGQEEDNLAYLSSNGAGCSAETLEGLVDMVQDLLADPSKLDSLRRSAQSLGSSRGTDNLLDSLRAS